MNALKDWFATLSRREQGILLLGALAVLVFLINAMVIKPMTEQREQLTTRIDALSKTLSWMQDAAVEVKQLRQVNPVVRQDNRSLLAIVDSASRRSNIKGQVKSMRPEGKNRIKAELENVEFNRLIEWLDLLARQQQIRTESMNIDTTASPGRINVRLILERPET